jgi:hypothetical protein
MQSLTPGVHSITHHIVLLRFACAEFDGIGNSPPLNSFRGYVSDSGLHTLHLAKLARGTYVPTHRYSQKLQSDWLDLALEDLLVFLIMAHCQVNRILNNRVF